MTQVQHPFDGNEGQRLVVAILAVALALWVTAFILQTYIHVKGGAL